MKRAIGVAFGNSGRRMAQARRGLGMTELELEQFADAFEHEERLAARSLAC